MRTNPNLLLIFTRNPELGKCKTRLAAKIGDKAALDIYNFLLQHTVAITRELKVDKWVCYSEEIWETDIWDNKHYGKELQKGADLGERMMNAFQEGFNKGYEKIIIIGSDLYNLSQADLENAFNLLEKHEFVIGPAEDGGFYLLGMRNLKKELFQNKDWGSDTVLRATLDDLVKNDHVLLDTRNDVDYYEDIANIAAFQPFLKHMRK
ncbi:TIGR04282 family arsenosugar biosynthesis glycosyltransferase [Flavobacteriaceae bacterium GF1]